jgi:hypothetical protein
MTVKPWEQNAWVDAEVRRADRFPGSRGGAALDSAIEEAGRQILRSVAEEQTQPRTRRLLRTPRSLALAAVLVLCATGAAAAASGVFVNANTHTYAKRSDLRQGMGPGEFLNPAGTNYTQVVKKDSVRAGISFPTGRFDWRNLVLKETRLPNTCRTKSGIEQRGSSPECPRVQTSTGSLNAEIARYAIEAWILEWRHAKLTHNAVAVRRAAAVIAKAPRWRAVVEFKRSAMYEEVFFWLPPFVKAVATGSVAKVDQLIGSTVNVHDGPGNGSEPVGINFTVDDPDGFFAWFNRYSKRWDHLPKKQQYAHGDQEDAYYLRYLERHGS